MLAMQKGNIWCHNQVSLNGLGYFVVLVYDMVGLCLPNH